jgi:hypothetical protein
VPYSVTILGLLLFIIFINDIVQDIDAQIKLFADDTSLYLVVDDPIETAETLNGDLDKIHKFNKFPEMPDCFNLKSNPLCHILSNALLITQKNNPYFLPTI